MGGGHNSGGIAMEHCNFYEPNTRFNSWQLDSPINKSASVEMCF